MTGSLILALALVQAPASAGTDDLVAALNSEPILASGIQVVAVATPVSLLEMTGPQYAGVVPLPNPCLWAERCIYSTSVLGLVYGNWRISEVLWEAHYAGLTEFETTNIGYLTGHAMALERARLDALTPVNPSRLQAPPPTTESGFSGGMVVGRASNGGGGSSASGGKAHGRN